MIPKIINDNKEMQELFFPTRYKIGKDGLKEMFMNEENKFDMDKAALNEMLNDTNTNYDIDDNKTI